MAARIRLRSRPLLLNGATAQEDRLRRSSIVEVLLPDDTRARRSRASCGKIGCGCTSSHAAERASSYGGSAGSKRPHNIEACPDGEIGRRSGLKIRRPLPVVGVQVPLWAPKSERSLGFARDFAGGLRRPPSGSSSSPPPGTMESIVGPATRRAPKLTALPGPPGSDRYSR